MTYYVKPAGVKYTDMAIWIDNNAYADVCDDEKLYEYLYHIAKMLAYNGKYFDRNSYYEDYAMYVASAIFMRYRDNRQFEYNEDGTPKLKKIKSVLNYAKRVSYPLKVKFERETYAPQPEYDAVKYDQVSLHHQLIGSIDEMNVYMHDIPKTVRHFMRKIPYKEGTSEWANIYLSCLLTFINSVTLSNDNRSKLSELSAGVSYDSIEKMYEQSREDGVILYHLDDRMYDYIKVLSNEIRHIIYADLSQSLHSYVPSDAELQVTALSAVNGDVGYQEEE